MHSAYEDIIADTPAERVLRITFNRPDARNALRTQLLRELAAALAEADHDDNVRCVILTGGPQVFAAGADIREIADKGAAEAASQERAGYWKTVKDFSKPIVAAVNGYCLGGGNELAMLCDIIVAGQDAQFGQPEIKLALIPGAGGTQRLTAVLGKAKAMRYILTGDLIAAEQAFQAGLVSEVSADAEARAIELAQMIASKSPIPVALAKKAVLQAAESSLAAGLAFERQAYVKLLETEDRAEGIAAFLEKRQPEFKGR
jgi:enoyl-CoA hydratase